MEHSRAPIPPPAPGLVAEATRVGHWLFRWRSYPPVLVLGYVGLSAALNPVPLGGAGAVGAWSLAGIALGLCGWAFRGWTVGHVPAGTSGLGTVAPAASTLNTRGAYSLVRHPLYFGNYLMWAGVAVLAGDPTVLMVVSLAFWLYYERIMMAEERFLFERFGDAFAAWAERTPAFWPRTGGWISWDAPFSLRFALGRDYPALYALVVSTTAVEVVRRWALGAPWIPSAPWRAWFLSGSATYAVLHVMRRSRWLQRPADG